MNVAAPPEVPLERLEAQLCELAGHLAAATARFLALVADFDVRRGYESWSLPSAAAWLAWKCQLAPGTAREHVRVARALRDLPVTGGQFAAGRLSYAKVRALTRIATPDTDACLADMAMAMTAGQLDRFVRAHRQVSLADDRRARKQRRVSWRLDDDGSLAMSVRLPAAEGQVVLQALRAAAHDLEHPHHSHDTATRGTGPDGAEPGGAASGVPAGTPAAPEVLPDSAAPPDPAATSLADALTGIAADYLAGKIATAANPDIYQVIVHVGPEALTADPSQPANADQAVDPGHAAVHDRPEDSRQAADPGHRPVVDVPAGTSPDRDQVGHRPSTDVPAGTRAAHDQPGRRPPGGDAGAGSCRAGCLYRRVGHPAHHRRCHVEDGPALSAASAQRIACAATVTWMLHDHDGTLLDAGRRHRRPSPALRRAVRERDKYRCQYPGCHSRRTDIHHIRHWTRGGKTRLRNLISLCEAHHIIIHELSHLITQTSNGTFTFTRPDGTPMPASPPLPAPEGDISTVHDAVITPVTMDTSYYGDPFDLHQTIWAAFANARVARSSA